MTELATLQPALPLLDKHWTKTIDFGSAGVNGSLTLNGRLLSHGAFHPKRGHILTEGRPQFPSDKYNDIDFVRHARLWPMREHEKSQAGFGLSFETGDGSKVEFTRDGFVHGSWPKFAIHAEGFEGFTTFSVQDGSIHQTVKLENTTDKPIDIKAILSGDMSINRAAYSQLTPQGDFQMPECLNEIETRACSISLKNKILPATHAVSVYIDGKLHRLAETAPTESKGPVQVLQQLPISLPANSTVALTVTHTLQAGKEVANAPLDLEDKPLQRQLAGLLDRDALIERFGGDETARKLATLVIRGVDYQEGCTTVNVTDEDGAALGKCILADHQCLPLGWNRDNYWQLDMLTSLLSQVDTEVVKPADRQEVTDRINDIQRGHLQWVFSTAARPNYYWARSYFAHGENKDEVFQLDQQCYPLLELAEYAERNPEEIEYVRDLATGTVDKVLDVISQRRWKGKEGCHLYTTEENPADDDVAHPNHFSSQILLWHTLKSLMPLKERLGEGIIKTELGEWADNLREDTLKYFSTTHDEVGPMFKYTTSAKEGEELDHYHDANDVVLAMAPSWGFLPADDERLVNTFRFGYSDRNHKAWCPDGKFKGLGSVHSKGQWPLGNAQLLRAQMSGIKLDGMPSMPETLKTITEQALFDGMLSEAVDPETGEPTSKPWFGWPASVVASILLMDSDVLAEALSSAASTM